MNEEPSISNPFEAPQTKSVQALQTNSSLRAITFPTRAYSIGQFVLRGAILGAILGSLIGTMLATFLAFVAVWNTDYQQVVNSVLAVVIILAMVGAVCGGVSFALVGLLIILFVRNS